MARISDWLRGTVRAELVGAFPAGLLNALAGRGVELWDVESPNLYVAETEEEFDPVCSGRFGLRCGQFLARREY